MVKLINGSIGFAASEIIQQSNVNDIAGAITQILIGIVTIIGLLNKNKKNSKT